MAKNTQAKNTRFKKLTKWQKEQPKLPDFTISYLIWTEFRDSCTGIVSVIEFYEHNIIFISLELLI